MRGGSQGISGRKPTVPGEGKGRLNSDHPRSLETHSVVFGAWKWHSQQMSFPGVHFKTSLESISYGDASFTLIILYQVGVTSCSL